MKIINEIEQVIAVLPPEEAFILKFWLDEFKAARRYKHLKEYAMAARALTNFKECNGHAMWN